MTNQEIIAILEKLQYQVEVLGQTVDYTEHPVESLIMEMDWGRGEIDKVHGVFEKWDERLHGGGTLDQSAFERDIEAAVGLNYQGLKSVVSAFYRNGQWTTVCEAYVDSFNGSPPIEYHRIMRRER